MLLLFSLREWHSKGDYGILANEYDEDIQPFVAGFGDLRRDTCKSLSDGIDMNAEECEILWTTHYSHIVSE